MSIFRNRLAVAGTVSAAVLAIASAAQAATELKVVSGLVKNHDQIVTYFKDFHDPLNAAKGPVSLKYIGGPEVTPRKQQGSALKRGLFDVLASPSSYYAGMVPESRLTSISNKGPVQLRKEGAIDIMQKAWKKGLNARIVSWPFWGGSEFHIYTTFKPELNKKTGISLEGKKLRSTALYNPFLKAMGATPIVISPGEVYTSLQRGVVNGLAWPEGAITKYGWQQYIKYRIEPGFWRSSTMVVMNDDKWNSLTKAEKDFVHKWALHLEAESGKTLRKIADADNAKVFAAGVEKIKLEGEYAKAYLNTVNGATWADAKQRKLTVPYEVIRKAMYTE